MACKAAVAGRPVRGCACRAAARLRTVEAMHPDDLTPPATVTHTLAAGQCLSLQLRRGDRLWLAQGRLQARPPAQWLGERLWQPVAVWAEGHQGPVQDAGEWQWQALSAATLRLQRRAPLGARLWGWLVGGWGRLTARWPGRPARAPSPPGTWPR